MINAEKLIHDLTVRDFPDNSVGAEIDVDTIDEYPFITHRVVVGSAIDNAEPPSGWTATVSYNVFDESLDGAWDLASALYDAVHAWLDPWNEATFGHIADVGTVVDITGESIFTRELTVEVDAKWVTQYAGSFELTLRPER